MGDKKRIVVTPVRREEPDLRKLARAIIDLAIELNESETAEHDQQQEAA